MARRMSLAKVETVLLLSCMLLISSVAGAVVGHIPHERLSRTLMEATGKSSVGADSTSGVVVADGKSSEKGDDKKGEEEDGKSKEKEEGKSKEKEEGKSKEESPGKSKEAAPGKSKEEKPGKSKEEKPGKSKEEKPGKSPTAEPPSTSEEEAPGKTPEAPAPGDSPSTPPSSSNETAPATTPVTAPTPGKTISSGNRQVFDVTKFGAIVNNIQRDGAQAFIKTWLAACQSASPAKMVIPSGKFLVGPVVFQGPCKSSEPVLVEVIGDVLATTDISDYSEPQWITFEDIDGLVITGAGTLDGQGPKVWQYNDCKSNSDCAKLPASLRLGDVKNAIIEGITSLNSKWFHLFIYRCNNVTIENVKIIAPDESPNTDGVHISTSTGVTVRGCDIGTGDDCIGIVQDSHDILVENIKCGPGHGISIGSLGKTPQDKGVSNIHFKNCMLTKSTNGARIKTWGGTNSGTASGISFQDIVMNDVKNPIIIDQNYGGKKAPSRWQITDISFKNIKGTSVSKVSVLLDCSPLFPCKEVKLSNINLAFSGPKSNTPQTDSVCSNAKIAEFVSQNPPACSSKGGRPAESFVASEDD